MEKLEVAPQETMLNLINGAEISIESIHSLQCKITAKS